MLEEADLTLKTPSLKNANKLTTAPKIYLTAMLEMLVSSRFSALLTTGDDKLKNSDCNRRYVWLIKHFP